MGNSKYVNRKNVALGIILDCYSSSTLPESNILIRRGELLYGGLVRLFYYIDNPLYNHIYNKKGNHMYQTFLKIESSRILDADKESYIGPFSYYDFYSKKIYPAFNVQREGEVIPSIEVLPITLLSNIENNPSMLNNIFKDVYDNQLKQLHTIHDIKRINDVVDYITMYPIDISSSTIIFILQRLNRKLKEKQIQLYIDGYEYEEENQKAII
jgi:hypothetical protein